MKELTLYFVKVRVQAGKAGCPDFTLALRVAAYDWDLARESIPKILDNRWGYRSYSILKMSDEGSIFVPERKSN